MLCFPYNSYIMRLACLLLGRSRLFFRSDGDPWFWAISSWRGGMGSKVGECCATDQGETLMSVAENGELSSQQVYIIDDEPNLRASLLDFFESIQVQAKAYESASSFLDDAEHPLSGCILLDVQMPGMTGLELQAELLKRRTSIPVVFMTGNSNVSVSVSAMKAGAYDFLLKPFTSPSLSLVVDKALEHDRWARGRQAEMDAIRERIDTLTPRETEVWTYVSQGLMNKQIAFEMNISEIMVKLHRGRMMKKMHARSVVDVVRMFDKAASA